MVVTGAARTVRQLYSLLLYLSIPAVLARLLWRARRAPAYRRRWAERFGWLDPPPRGGCLWVHAVSLGEVRAALPLVRSLQARFPDRAMLVTTHTPTGSRQVREALGGTVHHVYAPYDLPGAVGRFLKRTRPALLIIMETELWPNLIHRCAVAGVPVVVANARLSRRSAQGYGRVRRLTAPMLAEVSLVAAQASADAARFRELGAPRVKVTGNIKYDLVVPERLPTQGRNLRESLGAERPVLIAASTHRDEDEQVLEAFALLRRRLPEVLLLLVPRHPERFADVARLCRERGLQVVARSEGQACGPRADVYLGDTMGELLLFYAAADVAFVGGSLVPTGGHNVMEPALVGLPVLFGPHMFNFAEASRLLLEAGAAVQVADAVELAEQAGRLLGDADARHAVGRKGQAVVEANRGALPALLALIEPLVGDAA